MKSNICHLDDDISCLSAVLEEVDKVCVYNRLEGKNALRLRLLAEELCGMLPGLLEMFHGDFWVETAESEYNFFVRVSTNEVDSDAKKALYSLAGEQVPTGIMAKICAVVKNFLLSDKGASDADSWSLNKYQTDAEANEDEIAIEELERSIVAKLADDVTVSLYDKTVELDGIPVVIPGKTVEIVVKKSF